MNEEIKKPTTITGRILYYDVENANRRIYTKECALDILKQFGELSHNSSMLGELDFPDDRAEVQLASVSHRIEEMHLDEEHKCLVGTISICEGTPNGQKLEKQIQAFGGPKNFDKFFAIRTRGTGTINEKGEVENYKLFSCDVISKDKDPFNSILRIE